jgi:hypothetical protein
MNSGRALRHSQNQYAYAKQKGINSPCPHPNLSTLPSSLVLYANRPLRETDHFSQASRGCVDHDILDLGLAVPPYHRLPQILHSLSLHGDDAGLLDTYHTINGDQLRQLREMGRRRYMEASRPGTFEDSTRRLQEELAARLTQWEGLSGNEESHDQQAAAMAHDLCMEWGAKIVFGLHDELQSRSQGWVTYNALYAAEGLAWQNIKLY